MWYTLITVVVSGMFVYPIGDGAEESLDSRGSSCPSFGIGAVVLGILGFVNYRWQFIPLSERWLGYPVGSGLHQPGFGSVLVYVGVFAMIGSGIVLIGGSFFRQPTLADLAVPDDEPTVPQASKKDRRQKPRLKRRQKPEATLEEELLRSRTHEARSDSTNSWNSTTRAWSPTLSTPRNGNRSLTNSEIPLRPANEGGLVESVGARSGRLVPVAAHEELVVA